MRRPVALPRRGGRRDARAGAPGPPASPHRRRQPRRAADHRVHQGTDAARGHARAGRAGPEPDRRSTPAAPGGALRPGRRRGRAPPRRRSCSAIPRSSQHDPGAGPSRLRRLAAQPARAIAAAAGEPDRLGRARWSRSAPPGKSDSGTTQAVDLVHRIRDDYVPAAGFPARPTVLLTGAPAFGVDFIDTAYGAFPWLVLAVLVLSYLLLLRAFRSVVLPLKAVLMNLLSVSATYGVLVLVFQHGLHSVLGLQQLGPDRGVDPDLPVRDAVRPLDGLRGLPALAHARGVGRSATTTSTRSPTASSTPAGSSRRRRSS